MNVQNQANALGRDFSQQTNEEARAVTRTMTDLASGIGDLETALRALAGRISPLLPAGSPFERAQKVNEVNATVVPVPVRSAHCDELHNRVYQLRSITAAVNEMVKSVEI